MSADLSAINGIQKPVCHRLDRPQIDHIKERACSVRVADLKMRKAQKIVVIARDRLGAGARSATTTTLLKTISAETVVHD